MLPLRTRGQAGGLPLPAPPRACGAPLLASLRLFVPQRPWSCCFSPSLWGWKH